MKDTYYKSQIGYKYTYTHFSKYVNMQFSFIEDDKGRIDYCEIFKSDSPTGDFKFDINSHHPIHSVKDDEVITEEEYNKALVKILQFLIKRNFNILLSCSFE